MSWGLFGLHAGDPSRVRLAVWRNPFRPIEPTFAERFEANKRAFKARRARECKKLSGAEVALRSARLSW